MKSKVLFTVRTLIFLLGLAIISNAVFLIVSSNIHTGIILTLILGIIIMLYGVFFTYINKKLPKWIRICVVSVCTIVCIFVVFLFAYGLNDTANYKEDVLIVLGATIKGDKPSKALCDRLDIAVEYHKKNPDAIIVVSGGQGPGENITEARAMSDYLISKGVPEDKIIKEDKSTSTFENFTNTKALLDKTLEGEYTVAFATSEYHVFRGVNMAESVGFKDVTHLHSRSRWWAVIPSGMRECLAVMKFIAFGF
ncbi:MAG: YdcF family protein [Clostridiales bacterium]|nr:YdcF family protein [Clostridiales bacterium]